MTPPHTDLNVSRETFDRLSHYVTLLKKWTPQINLVSKSTIPDIWTRHILDSLQVIDLLSEPPKLWMDLGSGGGFPGLVAAIVGIEKYPSAKFVLVESDQRKCSFLRTVIRETGANATVITDRIEKIAPLNADVISARALADLDTLLGFISQHGNEDCVSLLPKGANWKNEVDNAMKHWEFQAEHIKSKTDSSAVVLRVTGVSRV